MASRIRTVEDVRPLLNAACTRLNLQSQYLGAARAEVLAEALSNCPALAELCLEATYIGAAGAQALAAALLSCPALRELNLRTNAIGDAGAQALAVTLPLCPTLTVLDLSVNQIGAAGMQALAAALPSCPALAELNLRTNELGDDGARALAAALPSCPALTLLGLGDNLIDEAGAHALAKALPSCPTLTVLYLGENTIGPAGPKALAEALPSCPALTVLGLSCNQIGDAGARALLAALPKCPWITQLYVSENGISNGIIAQIEDLLAANKKRPEAERRALQDAARQMQQAPATPTKEAKPTDGASAHLKVDSDLRDKLLEAIADNPDAFVQALQAAVRQRAAPTGATSDGTPPASSDPAGRPDGPSESATGSAALSKAIEASQPQPDGRTPDVGGDSRPTVQVESTKPDEAGGSGGGASEGWKARLNPASGKYEFYPSTATRASTASRTTLPPPMRAANTSAGSPSTPPLPPPVRVAVPTSTTPHPDAGLDAVPSPQFQALERELDALRRSIAAGREVAAAALANATSGADAAAQLQEQALAAQQQVQAQLAALDHRLAERINALANDHERLKALTLYLEDKLNSYVPYLDEALQRRELDRQRQAAHAKILASPKHDAYYRAYMETLNAVYQAALVLQTDLVKMQPQTSKSTMAAFVKCVGQAISAVLSFTPATPLAGITTSAATMVLKYFLERRGEREQRDQLKRLTTAYPNPIEWFDLSERAAAAVTQARWEHIAALEDNAATGKLVLRALQKLADYFRTQAALPVWQRTGGLDAMAGLDALMQPPADATAVVPTAVDAVVRQLVAAAQKEPPTVVAPKPSDAAAARRPSPAQEAETRKKVEAAVKAAERAELRSRQTQAFTYQLAERIASGSSQDVSMPAERTVIVRRFARRDAMGGITISVDGDLAALIAKASAALDGLPVVALRERASGALITEVRHIQNRDILLAMTAEEEERYYKE